MLTTCEYQDRLVSEEELDRCIDSILSADNAPKTDVPIPIAGSDYFLCNGELVLSQEIAPPDDRVFGMAGFASYDQIINAITVNGKGQYLEYQKNSFTTVAGQIYDYWLAGGTPAAGVFGTALTGTIPTSATTGALSYTNPTSPATMHLLTWSGVSTIALGTMLLYDRVAEYPLNGTVTSGTWGTQPALTRDAAGGSAGTGVLMFVENVGATANAAVNLTVTYTNDAGTGSRSTGAQTLQVGAISTNRVINPTNQWWFPLASGDKGVRSIQSYTLSATATSTTINVVLARPIAWLPLMGANAGVERDLILQIARIPRLYDNSALASMFVANTTTCPVNSTFVIAEN